MTDEPEARRLFRKAGGKPRFRDITGLTQSRVDSMAKTGGVPRKLRVHIYLALIEAGIDVTPLDFVPDLVGLPVARDVTPQPAG